MSKAPTKRKKTMAANAEKDKFIADPQDYGEIWSYTHRAKGKKEERKNLLELKPDENFVPVWGRIIYTRKRGKIVSIKVKPEPEPGMCISQYGTLISFKDTIDGKITAKWLEGSPVETDKQPKETHLKAGGRLLHRAEWFSFAYDAIINNRPVKPLTHNGGTEWTGIQKSDIETLKKYFTAKLDNGKKKKYVVHHMDINAQHNEITNLMLMPDSTHNYMKAHRPGTPVSKEAAFSAPKVRWIRYFLGGHIMIRAYNKEGWETALEMIQNLQRDPESLKIFHGMLYNGIWITPNDIQTQNIFDKLVNEKSNRELEELAVMAYTYYQSVNNKDVPHIDIGDYGNYNILSAEELNKSMNKALNP